MKENEQTINSNPLLAPEMPFGSASQTDRLLEAGTSDCEQRSPLLAGCEVAGASKPMNYHSCLSLMQQQTSTSVR
jgi:hypothetical protein